MSSSTGTGTLFALSKSASTGKWRLSLWQKNIGLEGNVILGSDGNFYGVSLLDVLKISATTHEVTTMLTTEGKSNFFIAPGLVEGSDGNFYGIGATFNGIGTMSPGIVFSYPPNGSPSILHLFGQGSDGTFPVGTVVQGSNGDLYGVTSLGGTAGAGFSSRSRRLEFIPSCTILVMAAFPMTA